MKVNNSAHSCPELVANFHVRNPAKICASGLQNREPLLADKRQAIIIGKTSKAHHPHWQTNKHTSSFFFFFTSLLVNRKFIILIGKAKIHTTIMKHGGEITQKNQINGDCISHKHVRVN